MIPKFIARHIKSSNQFLIKTNSQDVAARSFHYREEASAISLPDIKEVLKSTNSTLLEGHACMTTNFLLCRDSRRKECKIHVNKITGFFMCEHCKKFGPWSTLQRFLQPEEKKPEELELLRKSIASLPDSNEDWNSIKKLAEPFEKIQDDDYQSIMEHFNLQHVPQEIMVQMKVLYLKNSMTLYFPLLTFRNLVVGYKSLSMDPCVVKTVPESNSSGVVIYKQRNSKLDGTAILVPTIEDLLAIASEKAANIIICLPHGLQNIPLSILPSLESYKKLILWFGNDNSSWDCAKHFAKKLDETRCYFVRPTDSEPRAKVAASLGYDLKEIIQNAQPICHKSITTFHSLRQDVLSELQNVDKAQGIKWQRFPVLNKILKGHRRGEFTVLTGPTGCGKTTFMSEYSLDLAMQGVNTLWGSFEIRNARLAKTMLQQMVGKPLDENIDQYETYANNFEKLPIYFMTFHGQQSIKVVMDTIEHATYVHDIAHVIIDNVQFMMGMTEEPNYSDRFWRQDKIISVFRSFATKFNCHVSIVIHPRKEKDDGDLTTASIFGGAKASQEADNVLIVQDKRLASVKGKKFLQVAKNRYSGDLGVMILDFDKSSLSFAPKKSVSSSKM